MESLKPAAFVMLLLLPALSLDIAVRPNFIRTAPSSQVSITVELNATQAGTYTMAVEGPGLTYRKAVDLLPRQFYSFPLDFQAPTAGSYTITATVSFGGEVSSATAEMEVVSIITSSKDINSTLYELSDRLQQYKELASSLRNNMGASTKIAEVDALLQQANASYQSGRLISSSSDLTEAERKLIQIGVLLDMASKEESQLNVGLLVIGVVVLLIGFFLLRTVKQP